MSKDVCQGCAERSFGDHVYHERLDFAFGEVRQEVIQFGRVLSRLSRDFPLGAAQRVTVTDNEGRHVGIILVPEIHRELPEEATVKDLVHFADTALLPSMNVREAMKAFSTAEADALAVIINSAERKVIGLLTEQHALRRYNEELDRRQNEGNPYT